VCSLTGSVKRAKRQLKGRYRTTRLSAGHASFSFYMTEKATTNTTWHTKNKKIKDLAIDFGGLP
jgi:hypothetical protein